MTSPFIRNRQRRLAIAAGEKIATRKPAAPDEKSESGQEYAALKVRLHDNLRQLQDTESHEARKPLKAQFAKAFEDWVDGILIADKPVQDEIVLTCMIWAIDTGDYDRAVEIGEFAMKHGLDMPERYKRSVACFLREDIAELELANPGTVDLDLLSRIKSITGEADMPDAAKAKLHKAIGRAWRAKADAFDAADDSAPAGGEAAYIAEALAQLKRALQLDKKAGVKKDIEQLERRARDLGAPADDADQDTSPPFEPDNKGSGE